MHPILNEVRPGDIVFDIGANVGAKAAIFLGKGARVVCVEPQPKMVDALYKQYRNNENIVIVPKAVGERPGVQEMMICSKAPVLSTLAEHWTKGRFSEYEFDERAEVEITTLDWLIVQHGKPRYCKIDVEGYELQAILGLTQNIPFISYEFTAENLDHSMLVLEQLIKLGFQKFNVTVGESENFAIKNWVSFHEIIMVIKQETAKNNLLWGDIYARSF